MSGNSLHWGEPFLSRLEDDFELILFDNRGIGRSTRVDDPFTLGDLAEDAAAVLDALAIDRAHVMGISMGGMVAQELVLSHPERVAALVLGCTYCGGPQSQITAPAVVQRLGAAMMSGDRALAIRTGWELNVSPPFAADAAHYAAFLQIAERWPAPVPVIMLQMQAIGGHDTSARLGAVRAPTLVIHGTADEMLPSANGELIAGLIPGARLEVLDGVGHLFFWEAPERTATLVRDHCGAAGL
jgi:pimeloyl-ACP methyl ester carboxylesterase